jgi:shikimate dehydrogenase
MGWPVGHSLSPRLHGFWLQSYGLKGSYDALAVTPEDLPAALRGLAANGFKGVNLTIPHKVAACGIVDELDGEARRIGAVNLVTVLEGGKLLGRNTDAYGFTQNLLSGGFKPAGGAALVLGAGGACRAVLVALQNMGFMEIRLANRTKEHADTLAKELSTPQCRISVIGWSDAPQALAGVALLVNATSLGMTGQPEVSFSLDKLPPAAFVADIVYTPCETGLLRQAEERGNMTIDGLGMLLHQARPSFKAFFGRDPEVTDELRDFVLKNVSIK